MVLHKIISKPTKTFSYEINVHNSHIKYTLKYLSVRHKNYLSVDWITW